MVSAAELASEIANGLRDHIPINIDEWITQCSRKLTMYKTQIDSVVPPHTAERMYRVKDDGTVTPSLHVNCAPFPNFAKTTMTPKLKNAIKLVFEFLTGSTNTHGTRDPYTICNRRYACNMFLTPGQNNTVLPILRVHNVMMLDSKRSNHTHKLMSFIAGIRDWRNPNITSSISSAIQYANGYEFSKLTKLPPFNCGLMESKADEISSEEIQPFLQYVTDSTPEKFGTDLWVSPSNHSEYDTIFFTVCDYTGKISAIVTNLRVYENHDAVKTIYSVLGEARSAIETFSGSVFQLFFKLANTNARAHVLIKQNTHITHELHNNFGGSLKHNARNTLKFSEAVCSIIFPEKQFSGYMINDNSCQFTTPECDLRFIYDENRTQFTVEIAPKGNGFDGMDTDSSTNEPKFIHNGDTAMIDEGYRTAFDTDELHDETVFASTRGRLPIESIAPTLLRILKLLELH